MVETDTDRESRAALEWIKNLPGVAMVEVAYVDLTDLSSMTQEERAGHAEGIRLGRRFGPPISHVHLVNCVQCHVEASNLELPPWARPRGPGPVVPVLREAVMGSGDGMLVLAANQSDATASCGAACRARYSAASCGFPQAS